jgi:hypothetical protein
MATAALFKQTAFFLVLPIVAYLLRKPPVDNPEPASDELKPAGDDLDPKGFAKIALYVAIFVVAISLPFLGDISNYLYYIFQRPGGMLLNNVNEFPSISQPISFAVLFIALNFAIGNLNTTLGTAIPLIPEYAIQLVNLGTYYTLFLILTMIPLLLLMLLNVKDDTNLRQYWSRMMFLTLVLMLCVHLFSPRGIYKYYTVALIPFFAIQPVSRMIKQKSEKTNLSIFMVLNPLIFGVLILFPNRHIYLAYLLLILVGYLTHKQFSLVLHLVENRIQCVKRRVRNLVKKPSQVDVTEIVDAQTLSNS